MDSDDPPDTQPDGGVPTASEDAVAQQVGTDAVAGTLTTADGRDIPVALSDDIVEAAHDADVDVSRLRDAAVPDVPDDFNFDLTPRAGRVRAQDSTATIPVQDDQDHLLGSSRVSDFDFIQDPQIRKLQQNSVDYTQRIGRYLLAKDDLIPSVKERMKALIVGSEGMAVEPANPDDDADQRLAEHLRDLYDDDVRPTDVIDQILRENLMHARTVLRATDLEPLDLTTLDYLKDGISGEEIYMQDPTTVYEFDVDEGSRDEPGDIDVQRRKIDAQPLVIGEQVFDIALYDEPPLEAVADTAINKMVMQRLKARKAELTSFGAVYASVEPPSYLPEDQYFDRVQDDSATDEGEQPPTKLERALRTNMQSAFDHLKDWQAGTTMAIPDYWSLEQIEIPEDNEPLDDQIRGYNRSIARRMLVPLDLIELREGAELSRETLFRTLMTTIQGWRAEIIRVFDQFARVQKEIHDLGGDVDHSFPPIQNQDEELVVQALQYAGIAGLTEKEVRQMLNQIEGVDLDISDDQPQDVPPGGPDDQGDRTRQMQDFLDQQNDRGRVDQDGDQDGVDGSTPADSTAQAADAFDEGAWVTFRKDGEEHLGRVAYSDDERTLVKRWDPDAGELTDQATTKATSHVHPADPPEGVEAGGQGNVNPGTAQARGPGSTSTPLSGVPVIPDGTERLSKDALAYWAAWVRAGKPTKNIEGRRFNPELHPRGPDGKFVERPWDIPDDVLDSIDSVRSTPTADLLDELNEAGEPIDDVLANDDIKIDGIPDDVNSVSEAKERLGGDNLVFQDLEAGDQVNIVQPNGQKTVGQVQKTEVVDGGPNRAHVATNHGSLHVVDVPEGSTIERQSGPVIPPGDVIGQDAVAPVDINPNDRVSVVQINGDGEQPTHAATGTVTDVGSISSGKKTITVDGTDYVPESDNIQVYDASPDELDFDDIQQGDQVAAFISGSKQAEGEVDDVTDIDGSDLAYVTVDGTQFNVNSATFTEAGAMDEGDVDDVPDLDNLDGVSPGDLTLDDVGPQDTVEVQPHDVEPGDWVVFSPDGGSDNAGVGQVDDISGTGNQALVSTGPGGMDDGDVQEIELYQQDILERIPQEDPGPDVSQIEPDSVSATALNDDQLSGELTAGDFQDLAEDDWVVVDEGDGPHAGKVTSGPPNFAYETGHVSDPQEPGAIDNIDSIQQIDDEAVDDIGDEAGTVSPTTSTPDSPDSDLDVSDLDGPGTDSVTDDDLNHPATAEGVSDVGMVDEAQVKAFYELMGDADQGGVDLFEPAGSDGTSYASMTYPQANPYKLRDHVGHFANEALDADNGNESAERLLDQAGSWKGKSYTDVGQGLEKRFHAALDLPGDLRNDGLHGDEPSDDDAITAALYTAATQEWFRHTWSDIDQQDFWGEDSDDGELPLYRGVGKNAVASLARDWADDPERDSINVQESKITNFSTDAELADSWGERGHVIKKNATADDVIFSPDLMTGPETGIDGEGEIWLTGGVTDTAPENIQVEPGASDDTMDMSQMLDPPEDMDSDQLNVVGRWAEAMDKRDYTLDNQSQIDTFQRAADQIKQNPATSDTAAQRIEKIVQKSQQELQDAGPQAAPADD